MRELNSAARCTLMLAGAALFTQAAVAQSDVDVFVGVMCRGIAARDHLSEP